MSSDTNNTEINQIIQQSTDILYDYWYPQDTFFVLDDPKLLPVDPHRIASKLDIQIVPCPRYPVLATFEPKTDTSQAKITINASISYQGQRFAIAHTLYHALNKSEEELVVFPKVLDDASLPANIFAINLLCSKSALELVIEKEKIISPKESSKRFWVSTECVSIQMKELGYK